MRRREFITALGGATAIWPLAAGAQQQRKRPTIGFLIPTSRSAPDQNVASFVRRLSDLGWIENRTVEIEYRWADGDTARFAEIAAELVKLKVDIITTWGTPTALAVKQATSTIPIVFTIVGDPVGSGLVASLARPGGNVTGLSSQHSGSTGKRLELLREVVPNLRHLATLVNMDNSGSVLELHELQTSTISLGIDVVVSPIRRAEEIVPAIASINNRAEALYIAADALLISNQMTISDLSLEAKLPTMHGVRVAGGLMSYAPSYPDLFRRAAEYVDKILRGIKPEEIPIEQPTKFELVINLKTAKSLGVTISPMLLARADEVIE
jgi:putative tryptophan/tyrosine transport system substrate-binding protein